MDALSKRAIANLLLSVAALVVATFTLGYNMGHLHGYNIGVETGKAVESVKRDSQQVFQKLGTRPTLFDKEQD